MHNPTTASTAPAGEPAPHFPPEVRAYLDTAVRQIPFPQIRLYYGAHFPERSAAADVAAWLSTHVDDSNISRRVVR